MSRSQRIALLAAAVAVAVVAFVLLKPDDEDKPARQAAQTETSSEQARPERGTTEAEPAEPSTPPPVEIRVANGKPVGGVEEIEVDKGERVRLVVSSGDTSAEVHVHGADVSRDLEPGKPAKLTFTATKDGIFEIELEETATQIAELRVNP